MVGKNQPFHSKQKISMDIKAPAQPKRVLAVDASSDHMRLPVYAAQNQNRSFDAIRPKQSQIIWKQLVYDKKMFKVAVMRIWRKWELYSRRSKRILESLIPKMSPNKLVYGSIMSGVAFGMISISVIQSTFQSHVQANTDPGTQTSSPELVVPLELATQNYNPEKDLVFQYFSDAADAEYQDGVRQLVKGYPIEEMLPYIFQKDRIVAAFLIGIAKKESNWGKNVPVLDGQDCYNYWGYRGERRLMGSGGHTCFNSRKDAVDTVAARLDQLINSEKLNTPEKLIVWKCGFSCEGHSQESVLKWISDVDQYYSETMAIEGKTD